MELQPEKQGNNVTPDCWSVCLGNAHSAQERVFAAGYDNGDIKIFDLRQN